MLATGLRIRGARFEMLGKWGGELSLNSLKHKYPFMLALSQATTERLLTEALEAAGGHVERGVTLITCGNEADDVVQAELKHSSGTIEEYECPWMLAADGAHSAARKSLGMDFPGSNFPKPWYLADLPLDTSLAEDLAHVLFFPEGGFLFLLRVVDATPQQLPSGKLWRVISDRRELLERIPNSTRVGDPVWISDFHISHRINERLEVGNIYFAGDAAHIHSPMGARGMNLGLEDAWVFSRLAQANQLKRYGALRKKVDEAVVKRIEILSRIVLGETWNARLLREVIMRWLLKIPALQQTFMAALTGLDRPLEFGLARSELEGERPGRKLAEQYAH